MVGEDFGAGMYRGAVEKFCGEMGLGYRNETLPADAGEAAVVKAVQSLNADPAVSGILPLRPFPAQVSDSVVINSIDLGKDVDCFHPSNMGRLALGEPTFPPATPAACLELLERYLRGEKRDVADALEGAEVCVVGHSNTVGKPLALLLLNRNATTTVTHVYTSNRGNLAKHTHSGRLPGRGGWGATSGGRRPGEGGCRGPGRGHQPRGGLPQVRCPQPGQEEPLQGVQGRSDGRGDQDRG